MLLANLLAGCAGISPQRSIINDAKEFAKAHGIKANKYSGTVLDHSEEYFILFTRKTWFHAVDDHFGVQINKQTGEHRLTPRQF